jgi:hypothetical protein
MSRRRLPQSSGDNASGYKHAHRRPELKPPMSLKSQLEKLNAKVHSSHPTGALQRRRAEAIARSAYGCLLVALKAEGAAPDFRPLDSLRSAIRLSRLLKSDSIDVSFCRGDWRKFSDLNLTALAERTAAITNLGARPLTRERRKPHDRYCLGVAVPRIPRRCREASANPAPLSAKRRRNSSSTTEQSL